MTRGGASEAAPDTGGQLVGNEGTPGPVYHNGRPPTVLALHGFGATPREMDPVIEVARSLGLAVTAPLLPGHGTHARELAKTRFEDWLEAARSELKTCEQRGQVILAGASMGSVLAMHLAAETPPSSVVGLALMANAIRLYSPYPARALDLADWLRLPGFMMPKKGGPDIGDPVGKRNHLNYSASPVKAAISLQKAGRRATALLAKIRCPTLIIHGELDQVAPVANAWHVADRVGTTDVEICLLAHSHHILTKDIEQHLLKIRLLRFFERLAGA